MRDVYTRKRTPTELFPNLSRGFQLAVGPDLCRLAVRSQQPEQKNQTCSHLLNQKTNIHSKLKT